MRPEVDPLLFERGGAAATVTCALANFQRQQAAADKRQAGSQGWEETLSGGSLMLLPLAA
jgi:hypothetical protein